MGSPTTLTRQGVRPSGFPAGAKARFRFNLWKQALRWALFWAPSLRTDHRWQVGQPGRKPTKPSALACVDILAFRYKSSAGHNEIVLAGVPQIGLPAMSR
jgi:hypothetical protein